MMPDLPISSACSHFLITYSVYIAICTVSAF